MPTKKKPRRKPIDYRRIPYSPEECARAAVFWEQLHSVSAVAREMGRANSSSLRKAIQKGGGDLSKDNGKPTTARDAEVRRLHGEGKTARETAAILGNVSPETVTRCLLRMGLRKSRKNCLIEANPAAADAHEDRILTLMARGEKGESLFPTRRKDPPRGRRTLTRDREAVV